MSKPHQPSNHKVIKPSLAEVKDYRPNRSNSTGLEAPREPGVVYGVGRCESAAETILESIDVIEKKLAIITRVEPEKSDGNAVASKAMLAYCVLGDRLITLSERLMAATARINYLTDHLEI